METGNLLTDAFAYFFVILAYTAAAVFVLGLLRRLYVFLRAPVPLKITLTPGPTTWLGLIQRMTGQVLLFPHLFRADKALWLGSLTFHISLLLVLLRHTRYFLYPVPQWIVDLQPWGVYAGYVMPVAVLFLFWRRLARDRELYLTGVLDFAVLALLGGIGSSGLILHYYARAYLVDVKAFALSLLALNPTAPPMHPLFLLHFLLVALLLVYFPYGKLVHIIGIFLSPTLNQRFDVRQRRHVNPWDFPVD